MGSGKAPKPTAEQKAMERLQRDQLNEETASSERRLKSIAQKKIGKASLLGQPIERPEAPKGAAVTKGYQVINGKVRKVRSGGSLFGKFLGGALGFSDAGKAVSAGKAVKGAVDKKSVGLTMLGKATK